MQVTRHSLYQQAKERVPDYCLCKSWGPRYSHQITEKIDKCHQITEKNRQVPGLNRITECFEYQGSGHTGSYRCSRNYVEENTSVYKTV